MPKTQTLGRSAQPFSTSNASLAYALYKAEVPFADPRRPCFNLYDAEILKRLGYTGLTLEEAAQTAFDRRQKGNILYLFERTTKLSRLLKAYAAQEKEFTENDVIGTELISKIKESIAAKTISEEEGKLRLACVDQKMQSEFKTMWKKEIPMIKVDNPGKPVTRHTDNGTIVSHPGFKIISLNLSEKKRRHINL